MQKLILITCFAAIVVGCTKGQFDGPKGLIGKWELRSNDGGIAGTHNTFPKGNGYLLQLNADSTFKRYINDTLKVQGSFHIIKNSISFDSNKYDGIFFDKYDSGMFIYLKTDTLIIGQPFPDGVTSAYVRL